MFLFFAVDAIMELCIHICRSICCGYIFRYKWFLDDVPIFETNSKREDIQRSYVLFAQIYKVDYDNFTYRNNTEAYISSTYCENT